MKFNLLLILVLNIFSFSISNAGRYLFEVKAIIKLPGGCTLYNVDVFWDHDMNFNTHNNFVSNINFPVGCPPNIHSIVPTDLDTSQVFDYGSDTNYRFEPETVSLQIVEVNCNINQQNQIISSDLNDHHADLLILTERYSGNSLYMENLNESGSLSYSIAELAEGEYIAYILDLQKLVLLKAAFKKDF